MNPDLSALAGVSLVLAIAVPIAGAVIGYLILFLVVRNATASGLRKHQLWMERRSEQNGEHFHRHVA